MNNKHGAYSVKLGYYIARVIANEDNEIGESSEPKVDGEVWRKLWKLHVQNKIKVFGRRACQNILSIQQNLVKRRVIADGICSICKQDTESVIHVLWECGVAQDLWAGSLIRIQKCTSGQEDIMRLFKAMLNKLSTEEFEFF